MRRLPKLREIREERAMSQRDLALFSQVSQDTISKLERFEREAQPQTVRKLAMSLAVKPVALMKED